MSENAYLIIAVIIAYLLGSLSPSSLLARAKGIDIHKEGSGNPGTTNTLRVLGKKAAAITLVIDIFKGVLAVSIAFWLTNETGAMYAAFAAFIGHLYPIEMKFKGGKGVAVAFGVLLRLDWKLALVMLAVIALTVLITRKVSVGSLVAAGSFPFICWYMYPKFLPFGIAMAAFMIIRHRSNIKRLINHEEGNISFKKKVVDEKVGEVLREKEAAEVAAGVDAEKATSAADEK